MKKYTKFQKVFFTVLPFIAIPIIFLLANFVANHKEYLSPCLTYTLLEIHCPGCGATRASIALLHGDIITSLRQNCMVIIGILICAWLYIEFLFKVYEKPLSFTIVKQNNIWVFVSFLLVYTILRNVFPVLSPF